MNLHRTNKTPEWEGVPKSKQNVWQKIAEKTHGVVTPGNVISFIGLVLVLDGLRDVSDGKNVRGILKVGGGRICDILDGVAADKTGTKSPIGEAVDAGIDKVEIAAALPALVKSRNLPLTAGILIGSQNAINLGLTGVAKIRNAEIHSSKNGKLSTAGQWGVIGLYSLSRVAQERGNTQAAKNLRTASHVMLGYTAKLGIDAHADYAHDAFAPIDHSVTETVSQSSEIITDPAAPETTDYIDFSPVVPQLPLN